MQLSGPPRSINYFCLAPLRAGKMVVQLTQLGLHFMHYYYPPNNNMVTTLVEYNSMVKDRDDHKVTLTVN